MHIESPPLAQYLPRTEYKPQYGDYLIWSGMFTTWHGIVCEFLPDTGELGVTFAGVPYLLFTMSELQQKQSTYKLKLADIHGAVNGKFAIQKHISEQNAIVWYV